MVHDHCFIYLTVEWDSFAVENFREFLRENPTQIHNRLRTPTHCSFDLFFASQSLDKLHWEWITYYQNQISTVIGYCLSSLETAGSVGTIRVTVYALTSVIVGVVKSMKLPTNVAGTLFPKESRYGLLVS